MASKFGLAGGIPERRVRPIWDAIDSRQFKNALKLSTSLLAKYPDSPYALVSLPLNIIYIFIYLLKKEMVLSSSKVLLLFLHQTRAKQNPNIVTYL